MKYSALDTRNINNLRFQIVKSTRLVKRYSKVLFSMVCFLLAAYMTNTQVIRLLKNDDSTTIAFKRFNLSPDDKYPTFSMCFKGAELRWYNDKFIFDQFGISSSKYEKLLKGEKVSKYRYNYTSKLYDKFPVEYIAGSSEGQVDKFSISTISLLFFLVGQAFSAD